jgi:hypothetical protein
MIVRVALLATIGVTPIAIWLLTYRSQWRFALHQMLAIARDERTPTPSIFGYGLDLLRNWRISQHNALSLVVFYFCFAVMLIVLVRSGAAIWSSAAQYKNLDSKARTKVAAHLAFILAIPLTFVSLWWFLPASVLRYEVMYPVYLIAIALPVPLATSGRALKDVLRVVGALVICLNLVALIEYLNKDRSSPKLALDRYDSVIDCIPPGVNVAASPQLWLTFQEKNLPVTLLYPKFEAVGKSGDETTIPLDQFDVILLDDSLEGELATYGSNSQKGRTNTEFMIGSDVLHVYSRVGNFSANCGVRGIR